MAGSEAAFLVEARGEGGGEEEDVCIHKREARAGRVVVAVAVAGMWVVCGLQPKKKIDRN